jgi:hypothetical protein
MVVARRVSSTCKSVDHDARDDVGEEESEEDIINCIEHELYWVPM